jgi:hypothetical protein
MAPALTPAEERYLSTIHAKVTALRSFLGDGGPSGKAAELFDYLTALKNTLGNLNNDVSFVATLLVKAFLRERFGIEFDAALKPQGAAGADIECTVDDGTRVLAEIKTTKPYQAGFGANQKKEILKDLVRLATSNAEHRFMFVTDVDSYRTLCSKAFASYAPGVEIVDLVRGECYLCPIPTGTHI